MKLTAKKLIGRVERIDFPELGLFAVPAKVDTGAYTSSLHCQDIYESRENGKKVLCFRPLDPSFTGFTENDICVTKYTRKKIKNSFGQFETRFIVSTTIQIAGKLIETTISLSDRAKLRYPVLLGRRVLSKGFVIDVCKKHAGEKDIILELNSGKKKKESK